MRRVVASLLHLGRGALRATTSRVRRAAGAGCAAGPPRRGLAEPRRAPPRSTRAAASCDHAQRRHGRPRPAMTDSRTPARRERLRDRGRHPQRHAERHAVVRLAAGGRDPGDGRLHPIAERDRGKPSRATAPRARRSSTARAAAPPATWSGDAASATGPDLSNIGRQLKTDDLTRALVEPNAAVAQGYSTVGVKTPDGRTLRGFARNEGNYVLPLQTLAGELVIVDKRTATVTRETGSIMPPLKATATSSRTWSRT